MTKHNLITVKNNISETEAKKLLHKHRIEKLLVVNNENQCVGLITVKDIEKAELEKLISTLSGRFLLRLQRQASIIYRDNTT